MKPDSSSWLNTVLKSPFQRYFELLQLQQTSPMVSHGEIYLSSYQKKYYTKSTTVILNPSKSNSFQNHQLQFNSSALTNQWDWSKSGRHLFLHLSISSQQFSWQYSDSGNVFMHEKSSGLSHRPTLLYQTSEITHIPRQCADVIKSFRSQLVPK
ncbi:Hypothetical_protein [Hexamita inflata]|uniref:Hypothetical_protein n=1 Tax=Hexamita inflata TaxID=28002 RepID=A0AA86UK80_9EUKA|nr:Hypothetical protein HINF_LOCUS42017 [Hexamita inflata]